MTNDEIKRLSQLGSDDLMHVRTKMLAALSCANLLVANLDGYSKVDWLYINNLVIAGRRELRDARKIIDKQDLSS